MVDDEDEIVAPASERDGWKLPAPELPEDRRLKPWRPGLRFARQWPVLLGLLLAIVLPPLIWVGWMHFGPRLLLGQMAHKYASARALEITATMREDLGLGGDNGPARYRRTVPFSLGYAAPNRYYCRAGEGSGRVVTVIDGEVAFMAVARLSAVYRCAAPKRLPRVWPPLVGPPTVGAGGVADPLALVAGEADRAGVTRARFGVDPHQEWLRGIAGPPGAWALSVEQAGREGTVVLWIDRHTHLLRQAAVETEYIGRVITYETTALSAFLPPEDFHYVPPPGLRPIAVPDLATASAALSARLAAQIRESR